MAVELDNGRARIVVRPDLGAGLAAFDVRHGGGWQPVLRRVDPATAHPFALSSILLVPFSGRVSGGGFTFDGVFHALPRNMEGEPYPIHGNGFAVAWTETARNHDCITLTLSSHGPGPFRYDAAMTYRLEGVGLVMDLSLVNRAGMRLPYGAGFHPWFVRDADIYAHLGVTLVETVLAFAFGAVFGLGFGLWLALQPMASALLEPYIKALNSMPRIILAPIFAVWFGLGIASKVALGVTLVFFIVFFNVYQGVKEVSPVVLANARMLGASQRQLLRHVYLPSATSWVFSSLHTSVGLAFVGAVVGEYLGSARGVGYLILQAEGTFDVNTVFAGIVVLTAFALALDGLVGRIETRLMKWQPRSGETEKL